MYVHFKSTGKDLKQSTYLQYNETLYILTILYKQSYCKYRCSITVMQSSTKTQHLEELAKCKLYIARLSAVIGMDIFSLNWSIRFNLRMYIACCILIGFKILSWITIYQHRNDVFLTLETLCCYGLTIPVRNKNINYVLYILYYLFVLQFTNNLIFAFFRAHVKCCGALKTYRLLGRYTTLVSW